MCVDISQHAGHHPITIIDTLAIYEMLHAAGFTPYRMLACQTALGDEWPRSNALQFYTESFDLQGL